DYTKIQWAVDNASAGDTVIVRDASYTGNVDVNKPYANIRGGADAQNYYSVQDLNGGLITNEEKAYSHLYEIMDKYKDFKDFYVYFDKSASINHYSPSGWMGDADDITLDDNWTSNPHTGESCIKITYSASGSNSQNWAGIYWQYPDGNWGNYPGYNLAGATNFSFWARGENGNENGEFKIGGINRPPYHDPNLPYQDSFGPVTTGVVTLTNTWKKYTVNLTGRNLSNVIGGFCWVTNKPSNPSGCAFYLDDIMYENRNQLRFLESYESTPTFDSNYTAWTYDNALALLAFIARGNATDKARAQILADSFLYVQNNDQTFNDGRVRDGYWATDIKDPSGKNSSIKSPGSGTGNMAWTIIALLQYYEVTEDITYLEASKRLGNWIHDNCYDNRGAGGYTGGYEDKNFDWELEKITWKSTEHNIDAYVAFMELYNVTGNTTWLDRAIHANKFVKAMWNETEGHFWTGTKEDGEIINKDVLPADVNTWGLMALGNPNKYGRDITWVEDNCLVDPCPRGCGFKGFDFNDDKDGVWFEGTAHTCIAYQIMNETDNSSEYISEIRRAQTYANNSNGKGIVAACHDNVTTGFGWGYPNALHIGATSWYIFAERKLNPFWGINTSDQIPIMWYVDDDGGADFTSIQDAVDTVNDGDIIIVNSGAYTENVNVTKQLILMGVDTGSSKPVVAAGGNGSTITLSADGITLGGFTATNSGSGIDAGIKVTSNNNIITGNDASNNNYGIRLWDSSNNTISGNDASNNSFGICLWDSSNNTISGNTASNNYNEGIRLYDHSNNNIITGNTFVNDGLSVRVSSTRNIVEENIVNGKPLVYLEDVSDYKVEDAGQVILVNCNNITVENLDLSNTSVGVELWQTEDSLISNNTASNNKHGIHLWDSYNNIITGNTVGNSNWDGIHLDLSCNNIITGNTASNNHLSGICLWDSSNNNIIKGNTFVNDGLSVSYSYQNTVEDNIVNGKLLVYLEDAVDYKVEEAGQVILVNCSNITVENLDLSNTCVGVNLFKTENSIIANNTASNNNEGICLWDSCSNNNITGNTAGNNSYSIYLYYSSNNTLKSNTVTNNYCGIYLYHSSNNNITGNTASNNDYKGIEVYYSSNNTLMNNAADSNPYGIRLFRSSNNTLMNNAADSNPYGIRLFRSSNNTLMNNAANSNKHYGIWLDSFSSDNIITGNNASNNNHYGIYPETYSINNKIYLNNFINNTKNVYSSYNSNNIWNSTKEITYTYGGSTHTNYMGNYWSDYEEKYPDAEELGDCGIWDTSYSIDSDADNHPLMVPWENYFAQIENIFDTGSPAEPYPSISGTHNGTITPNQTMTVQKLYTYPCPGTGGHTEYVRLWNSTLNVTATWDGYTEDWHDISFNESFTLVKGETYNYTIRTGSYPQIHHTDELKVDNGIIRCTEFKDATGKIYKDWIPAIRLTIG
ncbi:CASH domain-dontaining protein, partial [Candidatus Methanophagaceae archaeon]